MTAVSSHKWSSAKRRKKKFKQYEAQGEKCMACGESFPIEELRFNFLLEEFNDFILVCRWDLP